MFVGLGMATASRDVYRSACKARIHIDAAGMVTVECGTIEQGCGSPTVYAQLAAEILEMPFERVRFVFGDTNLPEAPLAAGSQTSSSVGSVVVKAATSLREQLATAGGKIPDGGISLDASEEEPEDEEYAMQAFGAQFAQVEVDPDLGEVRVTRFVGAFDGGRILNAKTANSQYVGGIVWGISMALFEKTRYDARTARIMNANLSDYLVPTHADIPNPEVIMIEADDPHINPAGVKGIGEVSITGVAAAVANAVYHATGVRVRELPILPDKLLT
jgi:xanthine dehydrogenase YagR molybdenum-binding subunit